MRQFIILAGVGIALILIALAVARFYIKKEKKAGYRTNMLKK